MFMRYGSFQHAIAETAVVIRRDALINEGGEIYALKERWDVSGFLQAADGPSLSSAMLAMEQSYNIQGQSVGLFFDDGTPSFHGVLAGDTLGGPLVVMRPTFPQGAGAEYSTYRSYSLAIEWELPIVGNVLLSFHEMLSFEGDGGPKFGYLQTLTGFPQKQLLAEATPQRVRQVGRAVGYLGYPIPMLPLYGTDAMHRDQSKVWREEPKRRGPIGSPIWTEFPVNWDYLFEGLGIDIFGIPNRWI